LLGLAIASKLKAQAWLDAGQQTNWATGNGFLAGQFSSQILFAQARVGHVSDRQPQLFEMAIGCFANLIGQLFSNLPKSFSNTLQL
jgi:hypothetical protein